MYIYTHTHTHTFAEVCVSKKDFVFIVKLKISET